MAELDIKDIWAKGKLQRFSELNVDVDEVVGKKSKNVLYWVKFILWIEFWINVVSFPLMIWSIFQEEFYPHFRTISSIMIVVIVIYLFYYQFLIRKISSFDYTGDVYSSLQKIYGYLKFYLLHYRVIVWGIMPLTFLYSIKISIDQLASEGMEIEYWSSQFWQFVAVSSAFYLVIILIMHFLVNLIYGRKIKRLKGMISELSS